MARGRRALIAGVALAAIFGAAIWLGLGREAAIVVESAPVERAAVEELATNSRAGTVIARRRARLSPESGGRVVALPFREGDRVAAGDVLVELDSTLERGEVALREREVEAAAAEAARAQLAAERARRELERNRKLAAEQLVAADLLDRLESGAREAEAAAVAATAGAERARAGLELARRALAMRTLRAPFAGIVAELTVETGEWTTPSPPGLPMPAIVDLLDPTSLVLELPMDEVDAARLVPGLPARIAIDSYPGRSFAGRVVRVAPFVLDVEAQNRTVAIEVELDPAPAELLLPGTSADVEVVVDRRDGVLRLPAAALVSGDRVLVIAGDRLEQRTIEVGLRNWQWVEALSGVEEGMRVVTVHDRDEIRAGAKVASASPPPS